MTISYHKVSNIPFYSLNQFTQLQPLSHGKSIVFIYQHNQSQQIFIVKEVPFSQEKVKIYQKIVGLYQIQSLIRIRGICKMVIKYDKIAKKRNHQISQQSFSMQPNLKIQQNSQVSFNKEQKNEKKSQERKKQEEWLIVFMQKCSQNLGDHLRNRKRQGRPFKVQQITQFINQTLLLLETLEKEHISHRDIKPQNFLYDKGKFKLCDFEQAIYMDPLIEYSKLKTELNLTTVEYTSPEFFRNIQNPKDKIFDPYKLDLYALGVTILYMCSMGKFDLSQRRQYMLQNSVFHNSYMKQQRRRYLKNNDQFKSLNTIVKMMLEQDEYKRDTFITFMMKIKPIMNVRELQINMIDQEAISENSKSEESRRKLNNGQKKTRKTNWENTTQIQRKSLKSMLILGFSFFVLILIL